MTRPPELDELIEGVDTPAERERLERVHALLLEAGPPPELTPALASSPTPTDADDAYSWLPRRRWRAGVVLAFAVVAAAFGIGYLAGADGEDEPFASARVLVLQPTAAGPRTAQGSIRVGRTDAEGNSPMLLTVRGLRKLGAQGYYELLFTRNGEVVGPCGTFLAEDAATSVYLNAPYEIDETSGWAVAIHPDGHVENPRIVMET